MIVAVEGVNGIGKSTLCNMLRNRKVFNHLMKFPNKQTGNGQLIYKFLFSDFDDNIALLYINERYNVSLEMKEFKDLWKIVIDRYSPSNILALLDVEIKTSNPTLKRAFTLDEYLDYKDSNPAMMTSINLMEPYFKHKVISRLRHYERIENEMGVVQPDYYILLNPNQNQLPAFYERFSKLQNNLDTHEGFDRFYFSAKIYNDVALKGLFSNWLIVDIDVNDTQQEVYDKTLFKLSEEIGFVT